MQVTTLRDTVIEINNRLCFNFNCLEILIEIKKMKGMHFDSESLLFYIK